MTRGRALPWESQHEPGRVLIVQSDDGLADTVRPRLEDMEADIQRVEAVHGRMLLSDVSIHIAWSKPDLVIIDPISCICGPNVTARLAKFAKQQGCAIIGVRNLRRTGNRIDMTTGSILRVSIDPTDSCPSPKSYRYSEQDETIK